MSLALAAPEDRAAKRETVNLRVRPEDRGLIDRAARAAGKTRTELILESARRAAEEILLDRALLRVDETAYERFLERLDAPADPNERLVKSLRTPAPWDTPSA